MKSALCDYGNCENCDTRVLVSTDDNWRRFCCEEHAAASLISTARLRHIPGTDREQDLAKLERCVRHRIGVA